MTFLSILKDPVREDFTTHRAGGIAFGIGAVVATCISLIELTYGLPLGTISADSPTLTIAFYLIGPPVLLAGLSAYLIAGGNSHSRWLAVLTPVIGSVVISTLAISAGDLSILAQVLFAAPVLYTAYAFVTRAAWIVLPFISAAHLITVIIVSPSPNSVMDWLNTTVVLVGTAAALSSARDMREQSARELTLRSQLDPLTGLYRRQAFADQASGHLGPGPTAVGALLLIDLDHFKEINDTFGHPYGDVALQRAATIAALNAPEDACVSRFGGDEFAIFSPTLTSKDASQLADILVGAICSVTINATTLSGGRSRIELSASIGVAHADNPLTRVNSLYSLADHALYAAKNAGRGTWELPPASSSSDSYPTLSGRTI